MSVTVDPAGTAVPAGGSVTITRPDGSKLSKSAGDTGVRELRDSGLSPEAVIGRAAHATGYDAWIAGGRAPST